ncbi:uncharacterized protein BJX67DRAFT_377895 [Aspergillus lucknowensis]|uniref:Ysc84 actin-binding domain-containing protein n=1 Tax=Aspergillus lucknowensis TaxID=176173 RepID=A0ABR4M2X4_9EURO
MHNPLPSSLTSSSLAGECKKAERILDSFINPDVVTLDKRIPKPVLENAKGLAIFSVFEVGMMRSLRFGSGIVVARLPNGTWSAPSAIETGKLSSRGQFGMELTEYVYVLNTEAAVEKFLQGNTFTLGQGTSIAVGPFGRSAELAGESYGADIFAYCKTRTVFGGPTLEGTTIGERADANRKMYQKDVAPWQLLRGDVALPPETYPLMKILHSTLLRPVKRRFSVDSLSKLARTVPQKSVATELPSGPVESLPRVVTAVSSSNETSSMTTSKISPKEISPETRFYGQPTTVPQIAIEITDCSHIELPRSLTESPEPERTSLDRGSDGTPKRYPTILNAGRRSWSSSYSGGWSRHDPLPI